MATLCDRCKQEIEAEGDISIPPVHRVDPVKLPSVAVADRSRLPMIGGVYFAMVRDQVGYIGQTGNLVRRWAHHPVLPRLIAQTAGRIAWLTIRDQRLRRDFEREAIRFFTPKWNRGGDGYSVAGFYPSTPELNRRMRSRRRGARWETEFEMVQRQRWMLGALLTPTALVRSTDAG